MIKSNRGLRLSRVPFLTTHGRRLTCALKPLKKKSENLFGRLKFMGAMKWRRNAKIVELFCGRGSGFRALHQLGFSQVEGIDLSPSLAADYTGPGKIQVGDCRQLPFETPAKTSLSYKAVYTTCLCSPRISIEYWPRRGAY